MQVVSGHLASKKRDSIYFELFFFYCQVFNDQDVCFSSCGSVIAPNLWPFTFRDSEDIKF